MNILGVSYSHEANAAIFVDNRLAAASAEERFTRKKMEMGHPENAINFCLDFAGIKPQDLDSVVLVSENDPPDQYMVNRISQFSIDDFVKEQNDYWKPRLFEGKDVDYLSVFSDKISNRAYDFSTLLEKQMSFNERVKEFKTIRKKAIVDQLGIPESKIRTVKHERAHAYYGLYSGNMRGKTLVLTSEGMGDYSNGTVSIYENGKLKELTHTKENHIGHLYKFMTLLLGMKPSQHEYKVMGLAPYANIKEVERVYPAFKEIFRLDGLNVAVNERPEDYYFWFKEKLEGCRFDGIAGALQKVTEEIMVAWVRHCCQELSVSNVVISGGVAQNIKACMHIAQLDEVENLYVGPSSGDGSLAIGGCYLVVDEEFEEKGLDKSLIKPMDNIYLGPEYSPNEIDSAIRENELQRKYKIVKDTDNEFIADQLISNKVIARFSGRMEFGQRSLGNRSILANPKNTRMIRKLNSTIKYRDFWMPFTPTILKEYENQYLINQKKLESPFMTMAFNTTELFQEKAPAAIHPADDTARPQILEREHNPKYYDLIKAFEKISGTGALLNTSMNLHGEPMVCSPKDAIHTMENSGIDMLLFDHVAVMRK